MTDTNKLVLITPPDKMYDKSKKILLVTLSDPLKVEFNEMLLELNLAETSIYLYNEGNDIDWLMDVFHMADVVVFDIDSADSDVTALASLLVSYHKTYWMAKYNNELYGKLSTNRIFDLQWLRDEIGEKS
jgi:hypothetical protein|tara:strand:+ start:342 stop:731 length:390 start_codon:yes stop_codon:yes gene_type:complete